MQLSSLLKQIGKLFTPCYLVYINVEFEASSTIPVKLTDKIIGKVITPKICIQPCWEHICYTPVLSWKKK